MKLVLLTGMSGTGKSSVVPELVACWYAAEHADDGWCETRPDGRQLWREDAIRELLTTAEVEVSFIAGCEADEIATPYSTTRCRRANDAEGRPWPRHRRGRS